MPSRLDARIETERLIMRVPTLKEFEPWCAMMADEETARYIGGVGAPSQVWRGICTMNGSWHLEGFAMFSVLDKATGEWLGRVGPWRPFDWPGSEVGWGIRRDKWGKGYALEAAIAAMDFAVDVLGWDDIIHSIHPKNIASQAVAKKLGAVNRGPGKMPPPYQNDLVDIWGQSAAEWKARRSQR
jgi:RimJ/RimL family protein N-acetyltransferase